MYRVINRNKYIEKILCITLVIYNKNHYMMHGQLKCKIHVVFDVTMIPAPYEAVYEDV